MELKLNLEDLCKRGPLFVENINRKVRKSIATAALVAGIITSGGQAYAQFNLPERTVAGIVISGGLQAYAQQEVSGFNLPERTDCVDQNLEVISLDNTIRYQIAKTDCSERGVEAGIFSDRVRESMGLQQDDSKVIEVYYFNEIGQLIDFPIGEYCTLNPSQMTDLTDLGRNHPSDVPLGVRVREPTVEDGCPVSSEVYSRTIERLGELSGRIGKLEEIGSSRPQSEKSSEAPVEPPTEVVQIPHFVVPLRGNSTKNLPDVVYEDNLVKSVIGLDPRNGYSPKYGNKVYDSSKRSYEEIAKELLTQANLEDLIHPVSSKIGAMAVKEHYGDVPGLGRDIILHENLGKLDLPKEKLLMGVFNYAADAAAADLVVESGKEEGYTMQDLDVLTNRSFMSKVFGNPVVRYVFPMNTVTHMRTKGTGRALNGEIKLAKEDVYKTCGSLGSQNGRIACAFDRGYGVIRKIVENGGNKNE